MKKLVLLILLWPCIALANDFSIEFTHNTNAAPDNPLMGYNLYRGSEFVLMIDVDDVVAAELEKRDEQGNPTGEMVDGFIADINCIDVPAGDGTFYITAGYQSSESDASNTHDFTVPKCEVVKIITIRANH